MIKVVHCIPIVSLVYTYCKYFVGFSISVAFTHDTSHGTNYIKDKCVLLVIVSYRDTEIDL